MSADLKRAVQYALSIKPDEIYETQGGLHTSDEEVLTLLAGLDPNNPIYADVVNAAKERGLPIPNIQMAEGPKAISSDQPAQPTERPKFLSELLLEEEQVPMPTPESAQIAPADAPATFPTYDGFIDRTAGQIPHPLEEGVGIILPGEITGEDVLERGIYFNADDQYRQFRSYQLLPPSIGVDHPNPLPSWDMEMEPALPMGEVEDAGESYDPNNPADADPVQPPTLMQSLAEAGVPDFDPQSFLDQPAPVAGVEQTDDPTQFIDVSKGETFAEVFAAEPTTRLWLTNEIERLAVEQGLDTKLASSLAASLMGSAEGTGPNELGLGVADLTPLGLWNDFQEAITRAGKALNPTSDMDNIDYGSAAMNLGIAAVQAIPVPFAAKKFLSKALKYINDITSGEIVPGALSVRSVDDAGKTVSTADVIADPSIAPAPLNLPEVNLPVWTGKTSELILPRSQSLRPTEPESVIIEKLSRTAEDGQLAVDAVARVRGNYPMGKSRDKFSDVTLTGGKWKTENGKRIFTPEFKKIPYDFHVVPAGKTKKQWQNKLSNDMVNDVDAVVQRARAGDPAAVNIIAQARWYRDMRISLRREFGGLGDLFADLIGATSAQTNVTDNFDNAIDILRRFTRGDFDGEIAAWTAREAAGESMSPKTLQQLAKLEDDPFPLIRKASGALYNANSPAATKALLDTFRLVRGGASPKTINFTGNLIGYSSNATIDVWAGRYLRNKAGLPYIPPPAEKAVGGKHGAKSTLEKPVIGGEFGFGQEVFQAAADIINRKNTITEYDASIGKMGADDLQAVVWFLEKEKWAKNNWTTKAGEGGSLEFEVSLAGNPEWSLIKQTRKASTETFKPPKKHKRETVEEHALRVADAKVAHTERTGIATAELEGLKAPLERTVLGVSGERPGAIPSNLQQAQDASAFDDVLKADNKVVGYKLTNTHGRYQGTSERSIDAEIVTQQGFDPKPLTRRLVEMGKKRDQDSVYRSKVVPNPKEGQKVNPGLEIYFIKKMSEEFTTKLADDLRAAGVDGFTFITDARQADRIAEQAANAPEGATAGLTGIRMQYIPEFSDAPTAAEVQKMEDLFEDLAEKYSKEGNIAAANFVYYETEVFTNTKWGPGVRTYDEYLATAP